MPDVENPYLAGRQYRADEIGEVLGQRNWWRLLSAALTGLLVLAVGGLIYLGALPKHSPVLVHWDRSSGEFARLVSPVTAGEDPVSLRRMLREFVTALRSIPSDGHLLRAQWLLAEARVTKEGAERLVAYARDFKPLLRTEPVTVEIVHILPITNKTWQVRWQESTYDAPPSGTFKNQQRMIGTFTYHVRAPRTLGEIDTNPGGIWWHEWSISPE
jgi:type IV secretion system protein VirB5